MRISTIAVIVAASSLSLASLPVGASAQSMECGNLRRTGSTTRVSSHSSNDSGGKSGERFEILISRPGHCVSARIDGEVTFSEDESMVVALGPSAIATFRERRGDVDRMVRFVPGAEGGVNPRMYEDGDETSFDADARAWVAALLPTLLREAGHDPEGRVARYRARGGLDGALRQIATIESGSSKRAHYIALIGSPGITGDEAATIVRQAAGALRSSSGDVRALLQEVPLRLRQSPAVGAAVIAAVEHMNSDGDKRAVLQDYAATADRTLLLAVLRATGTIESDGDKRFVLVEAADNTLGSDDPAARKAWFDVFEEIHSDGDKRAVLMSALPYARSVPPISADIIRSVGEIGSDGDASAVLIAVARRGLLTTPDLRAAYASAARGIGSDGDRRRVLEAAERR